jgi:hypothetical protein
MMKIVTTTETELSGTLQFTGESLKSLTGKSVLPGQPRVHLKSESLLVRYIEKAHLVPSLDTLGPRLWWVSQNEEARPYHTRSNPLVEGYQTRFFRVQQLCS